MRCHRCGRQGEKQPRIRSWLEEAAGEEEGAESGAGLGVLRSDFSALDDGGGGHGAERDVREEAVVAA